MEILLIQLSELNFTKLTLMTGFVLQGHIFMRVTLDVWQLKVVTWFVVILSFNI